MLENKSNRWEPLTDKHNNTLITRNCMALFNLVILWNMVIRSPFFITGTILRCLHIGKKLKMIYISLLTWQSNFLESPLNVVFPYLMRAASKPNRWLFHIGFNMPNSFQIDIQLGKISSSSVQSQYVLDQSTNILTWKWLF